MNDLVKMPERVWLWYDVGDTLFISQPNEPYPAGSPEYVPAVRIEELEAENKRLNEQMDAIEKMGTESLNALPDCLMRLAPALVENDELKAKLAKAVGALGDISNGEPEWPDEPQKELDWCRNRATTTLEILTELKGDKND